jgi:predicted secreted Zn-dependent protease
MEELEKEHHRILETYAQSLNTIRDHEERHINTAHAMEKKDAELDRLNSINQSLEAKLR